MPALASIRSKPVPRDLPVVLLARVLQRDGPNEAPIQRADLSAITYQVFDEETGDQVGADGTFAVATSIHDTYQTGTIWPDAVGYNFDATLPAAYLPEGGRTYNVQVTFTLTGGTHELVVFQIPTLDREGN